MSLRTVLAIGLLAMASSVASAAAPKHTADAACTEHVKKMQGMKTSAERTTYCKGNEECTSHHCSSMVSHHKSTTQHHATSTSAPAAPAAKPPAN
jgi:hypothetical protein